MSELLRSEAVAVISRTPHSIGSACRELGIARSSYYRWRRQLTGPAPAPPKRPATNALRAREREAILPDQLRMLGIPLCRPPITAELARDLPIRQSLMVKIADTHSVLP